MYRLLRRVFCWKFVFYELLLPLLRALGPTRCDVVLRKLGQLWTCLWPGRAEELRKSLKAAHDALDRDGRTEELWPGLAAETARFLARDYTVDVRSNVAFFERFEVTGGDAFQRAVSAGNGVLLVGSHLGAYITGLHWLMCKEPAVRAMVQRPRHVSRALNRRFDDGRGPYPQPTMFLRRNLAAEDAASLLIRARSALRDGLPLYLCGDIPWPGLNARPGRLLGRDYRFLAIWTELAVLTRAPVFHVFCTHLPGGRFRLELEGIGLVQAGEENNAVADFLRGLEARIAAEPTQAVAHLLWPCFRGFTTDRRVLRKGYYRNKMRPSRRNRTTARQNSQS